MTDPNYSLVVAILDRSGSMASIKTDTEGGFDTFIAEQAKAPGKCSVTLAQFDSEYELVYKNKDVKKVPNLSLVPRGTTALHDAIGKTVVTVGEDLAKLKEEDRPSSVTVLILTDGGENSSHDWDGKQVKELIEMQQDQYEWRFIFMGSNQDAVVVGRGLGIDSGSTLTYTGQTVGSAFASAAVNTTNYRNARTSGLGYGDAVASTSFTDDQRKTAAGSKSK